MLSSIVCTHYLVRLLQVTDGVYMAIGFAIANSILLEGPEGVVIVDVTESLESGQEVLRAFRKITQKPIKALIYTHNHADHIYGAEARNTFFFFFVIRKSRSFAESQITNINYECHNTILPTCKAYNPIIRSVEGIMW